MTRGKHAWDVPFDESRLTELRAALEANGGNITKTAQSLGIVRQWVHELLITYSLVEFARELRVKAGGSSSGRGRPAVPKPPKKRGRPKKDESKGAAS